jgi:fluoroquinolone resistance protein
MQYFKKRHFTKEMLLQDPLALGEYEDCTFEGGNWMESSLAGFQFSKCTFLMGNLSMADIRDTMFSHVVFDQCKLTGLRFDLCRDFGFSVHFQNCALNYASFYRRTLPKTPFVGCSLQGVDFTEADLSAAVFNECDLGGAQFERTNLEKADFSTSRNVVLSPELNRVKRAKFSRHNLDGLLAQYDLDIV